MRLSELHPAWRRHYVNFTPETGGNPTDDFWLSFDCPKCGPSRKIEVLVGLGPQRELTETEPRRWHVNSLPTGYAWTDALTISPSITSNSDRNLSQRHYCGAHMTITNGELIP